jgi:kynureninase
VLKQPATSAMTQKDIAVVSLGTIAIKTGQLTDAVRGPNITAFES